MYLKHDIKKLIGVEYTYPKSEEIIEKYGHPVTLKGTNNTIWLAYFHKGNFSIISVKKTGRIRSVYPGMIDEEAVKGELKATLLKYNEEKGK